jgi:hypothetical protein
MTSEQLVKERIVRDLAEHTITCLHSEGMYRHWRCQKPGSWNMGFDIITWPGSLCYTGDMGDYLFKRTEDMVTFMSRACRDYQYSAEKCVANDGRLKEWREERFREVLAERCKESEEFTVIRQGKRETENVFEKTREIMDEYENYQSQHDAEKAMYESGLWDGGDMPSCMEYTFHFIWCLHAIKWFCEKHAETVVGKTHGCKDCGEERYPRVVAGKMTCPECGSENIVCIGS